MTASPAQGSFANRRLALPPVVAVLFAVVTALLLATIVPARAFAATDGNKLNVYAGGSAPSLSETRECGFAVSVKSGDYVANGLEPDYWTVSGLGDTTKLTPDESGDVTFTMPGNDVTLTAHYPTYVTGITVDMSDSYDYSTDTGLPVEVKSVTFTDSAGQKKTVSVTTEQASGSRSWIGDTAQNRLFNYTAVVDSNVAKDLGLSVVGANIQTHVINVTNKDSAVLTANASTTVWEDGRIELTAQVAVAKSETSTVSMTMKCANINTKDEITKYDATAAEGSNFSWDASVLGGVWQFAGWQTPLPDGASADGSILTVKATASVSEITAYYKPVVLSVSVEVPELSCGQPFPSKVTSYKVTDVTGEHDITDDVNKDVKLVWTTLDGNPGGNKVRDGVVYRASITTSRLAADGYQYATFPIMSNTETSKRVTLNSQADNVLCINSEDSRIVTGGEMSAHDGGDFDKIVTSFSKVNVAHALACEDEAVKTVQYQLKNETVKTADITWDFSGVDDTMTSGEFTIKGSFIDANGGNHEVSQTFSLMDLNAPIASPNDNVYEASQQVTLSLDKSFAGVKDAEIWYCVTDSNTKPAASDYKLYVDAFMVEKGDSQVLHTYAKVGQRQTALSEFSYSFVNRYAVKVNGGKAVDAEGNTITSAIEGSVVRIVADDPAEGKNFKAWDVASDTVAINDPASAQTFFCIGSGDVEVTATYSTITYTVSFNAQGGSSVESQKIEHGSTATLPATPERADYSFKGWYADAACTQVFDFSQPIKHDTTTYAKWAQLVTISFASAGGTAVDEMVLDEGEVIGDLSTPERAGHTFMGWYYGENLVTSSTTFAQSATLTAHWQPVKLSVQFLSGCETFDSELVDYGTTVSKPVSNPIKTGYTFDGWCADATFATLYNFDDPVYNSMKLFAKWKMNSYTVTFNVDGGSFAPDQMVDHGSIVIQPVDPVRPGYVFKGWYADAACTIEYNFATPVTGDVTVYAKWVRLVTVSFNVCGGTEVASRLIEAGTSLGELPTTAYADHVFAGWYVGETRVDAWTTFDADTMLTAHWNRDVWSVQYYDGDGETRIDFDTVNEGSTICAPIPTRMGYTFIGWYTDKELTQPYDFAESVHGDLQLYAKWEVVRNQVTFDSQGGTAVEPCQVTYGDTVSEPDTPEREGYLFEGWYADAACTVEFNFGKPIKDNVTVYAKWSRVNAAIAEKEEGLDGEKTEDKNSVSAAAAKSDSKSPVKPKVPQTGDPTATFALPALLGTATVAAALVSARKKRDE